MKKEFFKKGVSYKGKTGFWSKWGTEDHRSLMQVEVEDVWSCQSCRVQQPKDIRPFLFEYPIGEFIRVCSLCVTDNCAKLSTRLHTTRK